jgi:hypothetical protein
MLTNIAASRAERALRIITSSKKYTIADFQTYIFGFHVKIGTDGNNELITPTDVTNFLKTVINDDFISEYQMGKFDESTLINNLYVQLTIAYPDRDIIINLSEYGVQKCEIHFLK